MYVSVYTCHTNLYTHEHARTSTSIRALKPRHTPGDPLGANEEEESERWTSARGKVHDVVSTLSLLFLYLSQIYRSIYLSACLSKLYVYMSYVFTSLYGCVCVCIHT